MWITTCVLALAVPVKVGVVFLDGDWGWLSMTVGGLVSTSNVTGGLVPGLLPSALGCVATAVYSPSANAGLAASDFHLPPVTVAGAFATSLPSGFGPAKMCTVTGVVSLALPSNLGVLSFDGDSGRSRLTVGGLVFTTNVTTPLLPGGLPSGLACSATAAYVRSSPFSDELVGPESHLAPVPVAVAVATGVPWALVPA